MGFNGWARWFERLAAGERRARLQVAAWVLVVALLAFVLAVAPPTA